MNKVSRNFLKDNEIKAYSKPLGRPPKEPRPPEYYDNMAKAMNITTTWPRPSGTETKSNAPSAPARESTEPTTYDQASQYS